MVADLRRTVDEQTERAGAQATREAERVARDLRTRLLDAAVTAPVVQPEARFRIEEGGVTVRPAVALEPELPFDPGTRLDVLAQERVRRAAAARTPEDALAELAPLLDDPAIGATAHAWIRTRMAWIAHRGEMDARRDELLEGFDGSACADAAASALLLRAAVGTLDDDAVQSAFGAFASRASATRARALCDRLDERGVETDAMRAGLDRIEKARDVLRTARLHEGEILAANSPIVRPIGGALLLAWPESGAGAVLSPKDARTLCRALLPEEDEGHELVVPPFAPSAVPVADGVLAVTPAAVTPPGLLAGPTGTALLVAALALVCGGGSFLAFRALRREADALRMRTEFLTTVTHELKTPLAGVRLVAELLADNHVRDEDERRDWLRRLNGEAARLGVLIENVLDLGRLDRGERSHAPERCDVAQLVAETVALFAPLAERDGFEIHIALSDDAIFCDVDRDALRQALVNVLDNARKYGASPLEIGVEAVPGAVEIVVRDQGPGVPASERDAIFDRFRRGAAHGHGSIPGVGIGLHLARAIMQRHGGTLDCTGAPDGDGARFVFRIPRAEGA